MKIRPLIRKLDRRTHEYDYTIRLTFLQRKFDKNLIWKLVCYGAYSRSLFMNFSFLPDILWFAFNYFATAIFLFNAITELPPSSTATINSILCFIATYYVRHSLIYDILSRRSSYGNISGSSDPKRILHTWLYHSFEVAWMSDTNQINTESRLKTVH
jgi:hypothetical protein